MTTVTEPRGAGEPVPGRSGHYVCGLVGLVVAVALFVTGYSAIASLAEGTLGLLSSTAIVWLFVAAWLGLWLGMDLVWLGVAGRRGPA